jgi:predicted nucleic-acid-binding protein
MLAVDTNILVRYLTRDEPRQAARAAALMLHDEVWISKSVLLETEWVLRNPYGFEPGKIAAILLDLVAAANVRVEDPLAVALALELFSSGLDFADALHLASAGESERFVTFDEKLARRAKGRTAVEVTRI